MFQQNFCLCVCHLLGMRVCDLAYNGCSCGSKSEQRINIPSSDAASMNEIIKLQSKLEFLEKNIAKDTNETNDKINELGKRISTLDRLFSCFFDFVHLKLK